MQVIKYKLVNNILYWLLTHCSLIDQCIYKLQPFSNIDQL